MGRIIAIANQKGGVCKTTSAVNLAAWLSMMENTVLLVDIDPQGNATSGLGINKEELDTCMYDLLIEGVGIRDVITGCGLAELSLVPATME